MALRHPCPSSSPSRCGLARLPQEMALARLVPTVPASQPVSKGGVEAQLAWVPQSPSGV